MTRRAGIAAAYAGTCARCQAAYERGDRIVGTLRGYIHVGCASGGDDE